MDIAWKTLERIKKSIFDYPVISTNSKYLKDVNRHLKKHNIKKYEIILEPAKKNTDLQFLEDLK